jgi:hypothetical protein
VLTTSDQLLAHAAGDYVCQSDWMASEKTERSPRGRRAAAAHALSYAAWFLPLTRSPRALATIAGTHFIIDHWRLAKRVCWAKNQVAPARHRYEYVHPNDLTGHQPKSNGLDLLLMIAVDNCLHVAINGWAIKRWG